MDTESPYGTLTLITALGREQTFELERESILIGRASTNDMVVNRGEVSREHARIERQADGSLLLIDLGSRNGTTRNGERVERAVLEDGDLIGMGGVHLRYEAGTVTSDPTPSRIDTALDLDVQLSDSAVQQVITETRPPRLAITFDGQTYEVPIIDDSLVIGRLPATDIPIADPKVSRRHARIERQGDDVIIIDLNSRNGTWLGKMKINQHTLRNGDQIRIGEAEIVFKPGIEAGQDLSLRDTFDMPTGSIRPPVVFIPGFMGSELWRGSERIWPNPHHMFLKPETFALPDPHATEARGTVNEVVLVPNLIELEQYDRLYEYLEEELAYERGDNLLPFAYDWRYDVRDSAKALAARMETWQPDQPVVLIAHSMGGLVARYYVEKLGGDRRVKQLILLGSPNRGLPKAISNLVLGPNILPFGLLGEKMRSALATFPSLYQMIPDYPVVTDQFDKLIDVLLDDRWVPEARRINVHGAREFRRELGMVSSVPTLSVFGYGIRTILSTRVETGETGGWRRMDFIVGTDGDDSVPQSSAILPGSELHPVKQHHGALYVDNDVKMRIKVALTQP